MEDYLEIARRIFEGTRYKASDEDVKKLADNMALLEKRGLEKLNKRLVDARKHTKIFETIAEHNFAVILLSQQHSTIPISYEPYIGAPDFKVETGGITYWMQMKDLQKLERENRQDKLIQRIKEEAAEIKVSKFFSCTLSDDFKESNLPELINFIKDKAVSAAEEEVFPFTDNNNQKAKIKFWSPNKLKLSELTLGYTADLDILEITGLARDQIKGSLHNAAKAFTWEIDQKNINLIVMEADNKEDIDICDALFGTEYEFFGGDKHTWRRHNDGFFGDSDFSGKIAGVIAIKRKCERVEKNDIFPLSIDTAEYAEYLKKNCGWTDEKIKKALEWKNPGPIADYSLILYMNNSLKHLVEKVKRILTFDRIIYYNMRPPMGEGNFSYETE